jgi:predicted transcriptional regulator
LLTEYLRRFVRSADVREPHAYAFDEIMYLAPWPPGVLEFFTGLGIIREIEPSSLVWLWECAEPDWVEPEWLPDAQKGGQIVGFFMCRHGCGMHEVEPERRRMWAPRVEWIVSTAAELAGCSDVPIIDVPSRVWLLGRISQRKQTRDLFLVKGAGWRDSRAVLEGASRLAASSCATVLCFGSMPDPRDRPPTWCTVTSLDQIASIQGDAMVLPMERLFERQLLTEPGSVGKQLTLAEHEMDVLEALGERPRQAMLLTDLMAAAGYSKSVVRNALGRLATDGLVFRPNGTARKGTLITEKGLSLLKSRAAL